MGLDDFKSSGSSSSGSGGGVKTKQKSKSTSRSSSKSSNVDPMKPYFTAVLNQDYETVETFKGKKAFGRSSRHKHEQILCIIEDEERFERMNNISETYTDRPLDRLFKRQPNKAEDLVTRFQNEDASIHELNCPICDTSINMKGEDYTKVFGEVVHAHHDVQVVVEELDED